MARLPAVPTWCRSAGSEQVGWANLTVLFVERAPELVARDGSFGLLSNNGLNSHLCRILEAAAASGAPLAFARAGGALSQIHSNSLHFLHALPPLYNQAFFT